MLDCTLDARRSTHSPIDHDADYISNWLAEAFHGRDMGPVLFTGLTVRAHSALVRGIGTEHYM